ncbi:MAG: TIGR04282 family arsenosugar biosynthesis glycosyltransferase [Saprospiraceae bacterium]
MPNHLLVFIKNPRLGYVKTRLARTVGEAEALRIYRVLLEKTRRAALGTAARRWLFYSDFIEKRDGWRARDFTKRVQAQSPDLGLRMADAFREAFAAGAKRAVIIGSDCPQLSPEILRAAFQQLENEDFVLGPATDGGYYLLGMRAFRPEVFHGVAWSTEAVFEQTMQRIHALGTSVALLPELTDVDTEADWVRVMSDE